jgi:transglutaminase-like putative cysteine protease
MSAQAAAAPALLAGHTAQRPASAARLWPRAVSFLALAAFSSLVYGGLVISPPAGRLLAVCAIATAGSASLGLRRRDGRALLGLWPLRLFVLCLTLVLCVLALGVPAHLLAPHGWSRLGHDVARGTDGLGAWLWPYRGGREWTRLCVLLIVPVTLVLAGGLCFWPARAEAGSEGRGGEVRRSLALALLVVLFLTGAANSSQPEPGLRGLVLLVLIAAWLWLPALSENEIIRAGRWLVLCALLALAGRAALGSPAPWLGFREAIGAQQSASFQWDQVYGPIDWSRSTATMFSVAATRPGLMRVTSLDRFDGLRFLRSDAPPGSAEHDLSAHARTTLRTLALLRPGARALGHVRGAGIEQATITVAGLRSSLLVGAEGLAVDVSWMEHGGPVLRREADGTLATSQPLATGGVYTVTSYRPQASAARLRRAPRVFPRSYLPYARFELPGQSASALARPHLAAEANAALPAQAIVGAPAPGRAPASDPAMAARIGASPYAPMFRLARGLAAGAPSTYDVAERIDRYLLANYTYDEHVPQARYPLEAFLFEQHRGYCQQFSGAMTLMLRMDGIPARVGSGFKPAVYDAAAGIWRVRPVDAHSWVEVFFAGVGWVSFDPTPAAPVKLAGGSGGQSKNVITGGRASAGGSAATLAASRRVSTARRGGADALGVGVWAFVVALLALVTGAAWLAAHLRLRRALAGDGGVPVAELRRALSLLGAADGSPTLAALEQRFAGEGRKQAARYLAALRARRYGVVVGAAPSIRGRAALIRALRPSLREPRSIRTALSLSVAMPPAALRRRRSSC